MTFKVGDRVQYKLGRPLAIEHGIWVFSETQKKQVGKLGTVIHLGEWDESIKVQWDDCNPNYTQGVYVANLEPAVVNYNLDQELDEQEDLL